VASAVVQGYSEIERRLLSVKTRMSDNEVKTAFAALAAKAGAEKVEGVLLREVTLPNGMRWLNPDPMPMSPKMAADLIARMMVEAARPV
jgi:hypothetical protein